MSNDLCVSEGLWCDRCGEYAPVITLESYDTAGLDVLDLCANCLREALAKLEGA